MWKNLASLIFINQMNINKNTFLSKEEKTNK